MSSQRNPRYLEGAFSLVEVIVAISIATFALFALISLLPIGMKANRDSLEESQAANVFQAMIADRRASPATAASVLYGLPALNSLSNVQQASFWIKEDGTKAASENDARYRIDYKLTPSSGFGQPVYLHLRAIWPAGSTNQSGGLETLASFRS